MARNGKAPHGTSGVNRVVLTTYTRAVRTAKAHPSCDVDVTAVAIAVHGPGITYLAARPAWDLRAIGRAS